jgi:riboflavin-specific deaminase-like protein
MFVFSNLAVSLDGKIATADRGFFPLGTPEDRLNMLRLRREADALVMGASTLRSWRKPCLAGDVDRHPVNVILSSRLEGIVPTWEFFRSRKIARILFVAHDAPRARIRRFARSCEVIPLKRPTPRNAMATQVLRALDARGLRRVLIEGGGGVMWDFVSRDAIDEYHVTLTPKLLGGANAPTLVDGPGFRPRDVLSLKLVQSRVVGDEIYLIYRKQPRSG